MKNNFTLATILAMGLLLTSCLEETKKMTVTPISTLQSAPSGMRCIVDNSPWEADYPGTASSIVQAQYLASDKSLIFRGVSDYGVSASMGIEFDLKNVDFTGVALHQQTKVIFADPDSGGSTVSVQISGPAGFKYLSFPDGNSKSYAIWEVAARESNYVIVRGVFQVYFPKTDGGLYSIRQGEFEIRVTTDRF